MLALREFMDRPEGWGRDQGREVYQRLLRFVEDSAGTIIFRVSMKGVQRLDISFASETVVELARRYRRMKGFCLIDITDNDLIENLDAAAKKKDQPIVVWKGNSADVIGVEAKRRSARGFSVRDGDGRNLARPNSPRERIVDRKRKHEIQAAMGTGFFAEARKCRGQRRR